MNDLFRILGKVFAVLAASSVAAGIGSLLYCNGPGFTYVTVTTEQCVAILVLCLALAVIFAVVAVLLGQGGR